MARPMIEVTVRKMMKAYRPNLECLLLYALASGGASGPTSC